MANEESTAESNSRQLAALPAGRSIPSLDGLRALSVGFVVLGHAARQGYLPAFVGALPGIGFLSNGGLGVSVFFVISGFLITRILLLEEDNGRIDLGRFYVRRAFRIFPPFYTYLGVVAVLAMRHFLVVDWRSFFSAATYTWNYYPAAKGWDLAHIWSLSLEEQFYLLWPACLVLAGRRHSLRTIGWIIALAPVSRVVTYYLAPSMRGQIGMMLHTRIDTIAFGCALALLWDNRRFQLLLNSALKPIVLLPALAFLLVGSSLLETRFTGSYMLPVGYTLNAAAISLLLIYCVNSPESIPGRILNTRILRHFGIISYSIYLWQQLFLGAGWGSLLRFNIALALIAAELSFLVIEMPAQRLRDHVMVGRRRRRSETRREGAEPCFTGDLDSSRLR